MENEEFKLLMKAIDRETKLSVSRIAAMVGFEESAAFSKFFRNQTGKSPRDFRAANGKQA